MKKTNRRRDPAYDRLGNLPATKPPVSNDYEDSMIGHFDANGDLVTPPDAVSIPVD